MASTRELDPRFRPYADALVAVAHQAGLAPVVTSARRSRRAQAILYAKFLQGQMPYTVLPPGRSVHEYGLAVDIWCRNLPALGRLAQSWGLVWGGTSDPVHFAAVRSVDQLRVA